MNKDELLEFIKHNLSLSITLDKKTGWYGSPDTLKVKVTLNYTDPDAGYSHYANQELLAAEDSLHI